MPKVRSCSEGVASSEGRTFGTHFVGVSTHPGTTALYRVMIGHATLWLLLCGSAARGAAQFFFHFVTTNYGIIIIFAPKMYWTLKLPIK